MKSMERMTDEDTLRSWMSIAGLDRLPGISSLEAEGRIYGRGEMLAGPERPLRDLLFIVDGLAFIYGILDDGTMVPVASATRGMIIGDAEFAGGRILPIFAEVRKEIRCIAMAVDGQKEKLEQNPAILMRMLSSVVDKLGAAASLRIDQRPLEERILSYIRNECPQQTLSGIDNAAFRLHSSRRQMHRTLSRLCDEGVISRISKGRYILISEP